MSTPLSGSPTVGLGRFIKESSFHVPSHQRDYSWIGDYYVKEFLDDIEEALTLGRETYFCGLMVFTSVSSAVFKVLDGQQRLATTLMLFSAVRNWFRKFPEYDDLRSQVEEYLGSRELGSQDIQPRLSLTTANNDTFQRFVINTRPLADMLKEVKVIEDRSKTLLESIIYVNRYVDRRADQCETRDAAKDHFIKILKYLSDHVQIVRFVLSSDDAAYTIFETLNDRGLELSPLDLVKNYLFSHAEKYRKGSLPEFEWRWTEMMALLSSSKADSFLRAFWTSRYGKPEGAKLFTAFKKVYKQPEKMHGVSLELRRDAERYAALFSSVDPIWSEYGPKARQSIDALSIIGFSQAYPVILSALDKFNRREMERLLWLIECVAVRHQLIGRRRPGRVESLGARAATEIASGVITAATGVMTVIRELYVPDEEFKLSFENFEETSSKKIRYLLAGIERELVAREQFILDGELIPGALTVEHIFPKSPSPDWRLIAENDNKWEDSRVMRLGNMCLLPGINHSLGNKSYQDKINIYSKSRLRTTSSLNKYEKWGREEIDHRQKIMANLALGAWRFQ